MIEYYFKAWDLDGCRVDLSPQLPRKPMVTVTSSPACRPSEWSPASCTVTISTTAERSLGLSRRTSGRPSRLLPRPATTCPTGTTPTDPSSGVSNGIGAYTSVTDASSIFCTAYEKVIHDSGDLNSVTITEGTENSDKSNDAQLLVDWMNVSEHKVGLLVMGDQVAYDLSNSAAARSSRARQYDLRCHAREQQLLRHDRRP